jgi:hypothetical protein
VCRQKSRRRQLQTLFQWLSMAGLVPATTRMLPSGGFLVGGPWWAVVAPRRFKRELEKESQINQRPRLYETLCRKVYVEKTSRTVLYGEVFSKAAICLDFEHPPPVPSIIGAAKTHRPGWEATAPGSPRDIDFLTTVGMLGKHTTPRSTIKISSDRNVGFI